MVILINNLKTKSDPIVLFDLPAKRRQQRDEWASLSLKSRTTTTMQYR